MYKHSTNAISDEFTHIVDGSALRNEKFIPVLHDNSDGIVSKVKTAWCVELLFTQMMTLESLLDDAHQDGVGFQSKSRLTHECDLFPEFPK